ncbi:antitoxin AF2212-like protein [Baaleninema simplex]|uniref:antitoxin AF2212-like protein n=1 Tax=Baaleninema simplex TaxID=2862350 RepID=UPI000347C41F|nr:antitoxin AF2212-like protein [Baaleninema simplex]
MKIKAIFDGEVLRPVEPIELEPNTTVELELELETEKPIQSNDEISFFDVVESLNLEGPSDWAKNIDR